MQKKQEDNEATLQQYKQQMTLLVIDKKKVKLKESGLPQQVIDSTPWYLRRSKVPIAKVKVGPKIMNLMVQAELYDLIPVKKEIKATVSGIYIIGVKGLRGSLEQRPVKKSFFGRIKSRFTGK